MLIRARRLVHFLYFFSKFRRKIMSSLNPDANYEELVSVRLVGMMLTIVVRQELRKNVTQTETQTVTSGALYKYLVIFDEIAFVKHWEHKENDSQNNT